MVFAGCGDVLEVGTADRLSLVIDGPFGDALAEADNLVLRAARALAEGAGVAPHAALRLTKMLPVASGIGGGSADAAAALRVLAAHWNIAPADDAMALRLGADVPVCLQSRPRRMQGVGDVLLPAPCLPPFGLLLVNPGVAVATQAVFRARTGDFRAPAALPAGWPDAAAMAADLRSCANDLEPAAVALAPVIGAVLARLRASPGALLARMSGSGATCFALFATPAEAAAASVALDEPAWWRWGGGLAEPPQPP